MKALICLVMLLAFTASVANAVEYTGYDPQRILTVSDNASGQKVYGLDMRYLDRMLGDLSQHAGRYPPSFDSTEQKLRAAEDLNALSGMLGLLLKDGNPNPQILLRSAIVNRMSHNLDVPGAAVKAQQQFSQLLQLDPDNTQANYQFGVFLAESGQAEQGIPYLDKAVAMGLPQANYSLGLAYFGLGQKGKAINNLQSYLQQKPEDASASKLLRAMQDGSLKANSR